MSVAYNRAAFPRKKGVLVSKLKASDILKRSLYIGLNKNRRLKELGMLFTLAKAVEAPKNSNTRLYNIENDSKDN